MTVPPGPGAVPSMLQTWVIERFQNSIDQIPVASVTCWPSTVDLRRRRPRRRSSPSGLGAGLERAALREIVLAVRRVDLVRQTPGERDRSHGDRDALTAEARPSSSTRRERASHESRRSRGDDRAPCRSCRPASDELAVREREDREPVRLVVREAVDRRGRSGSPRPRRARAAPAADERPPGRRAARQERGERGERERRQVDEVPLDDQAREDGREVRALDARRTTPTSRSPRPRP